jgi:hypothetical protein
MIVHVTSITCVAITKSLALRLRYVPL